MSRADLEKEDTKGHAEGRTHLGALLEPEQVGEDAAAAALDDPRLAGAQQRQQAVQETVLQHLPSPARLSFA